MPEGCGLPMPKQRRGREIRWAQRQATVDLPVRLWVHRGILPEDDVRLPAGPEKKREIGSARKPALQAWITTQNAKPEAIDDRLDALRNEAESDRWFGWAARDFDKAPAHRGQRGKVSRAGAPMAMRHPLLRRKIPEACDWKKPQARATGETMQLLNEVRFIQERPG